MDLSNKKILFQARKEQLLIYVWPILFGVLALRAGGNLSSHQSMLYHSTGKDFSTFCAWFSCFAIGFLLSKITYIKQFYIAEDGFILREGLSGKWHVIDFDKMIAAIVKKPTTRCYSITIYCNNNEKFNLDNQDYFTSGLNQGAEALVNKNVRLCKDFMEAEGIVASYTPEELEKLGSSEPADASCNDVYLHYFVAFLPLLIAGCFYLTQHTR